MPVDLATPGLYLRTIRNLRPVQLVYFPLRRTQRALRRVAPGIASARYPPPRSAPGVREGLADMVWAMARALRIREHADLDSLKHGEVSILGRQVALEEVDWEEDYRPPLWAYHLHYLEGAVALACEARLGDREAYQALKQWVLVWIARCRPGRGPGWDPYPISQRVVNWAWMDLLLSGQYDDPGLFVELRKSVIQ